MKIIKIKKQSQIAKNPSNKKENQYTIRNMLKDLSKWENFLANIDKKEDQI